MAELVAYEDTPLGDYLKEIEASEPLQALDTTSIGYKCDIWQRLKEYLTPPAADTTNYQITNLLVQSGLLSQQYTPGIPKLSIHKQSPTNLLLLPLTASGIYISSRHRYSIPAVAVLSAYGFYKYRKQSRLTKLTKMLQQCQELDSQIQRCLRFIQEVDFIAKGFRLPQPTQSLVPIEPQEGSQWMAQNLRMAVKQALTQSLEVLSTLNGRPKDPLDEYDDSLASLKSLFSLHFNLRKQWLESLLMTNGPAQSVISLLTESYTTQADNLQRARDTQYMSPIWKDIRATRTNHPLILGLGRMSATLDTIQAKLLVIREMKGTDQDMARVFGSLKADLDLLNGQYQSSIATATQPPPTTDPTPDIPTPTPETNTNVDDVETYGYVPVDIHNMDAPNQIFEADETAKKEPKKDRLGGLDRNERIQLMRQQRKDQESQKSKRTDILSMMSELKSALPKQ